MAIIRKKKKANGNEVMDDLNREKQLNMGLDTQDGDGNGTGPGQIEETELEEAMNNEASSSDPPDRAPGNPVATSQTARKEQLNKAVAAKRPK